MRQVFRLMDMPDRVIAFDELPADLLVGLELIDCSKLPREWREFIGIREKHIKIKPERNLLTGKMEEFPALVQKAPYAYSIDRELNQDKERWAEIESYVKRNAPKDFRLTDPMVDIQTGKSTMAKPMARDANSELDLEVEDIIVVPLPKIPEVKEPEAASVELAKASFPCSDCEKVFEGKQALRMHRMKKHSEKKVEVPA